MTVGLVVVALCAVVAAGAMAWMAATNAGRTAQAATERLLEASLKLHEMRPDAPPLPEPIIVPAPDLRPYFEQLTTMAGTMARELAAGISLVVTGPPGTQPPPQAQEDVIGGSGPAEEEPDEPYVPAWDTDDTWGLRDPTGGIPGDEWSASFFPDMALRGNGAEDAPFGSGGIHLPDNEGL